MGSIVILDDSSINSSEILPRVTETTANQGIGLVYGIAVGGDTDGIYGDGSASTDDTTRATTGVGQGVVVVTQGRCPARVRGSTNGVNNQISIGVALTQSAVAGVLEQAATGDVVIARTLNRVTSGIIDIIAVDVQREGTFP